MQISVDLISALAAVPRHTFQPFEANKKSGTIILKFAEPAYKGVIDSNPAELILDNMRIYYLRSLSVFFAYAFCYDNKIIAYHDKYVTIMRPSSAELVRHTGVRHRHHDLNINVYESQDGSALISLHGLEEIITRSMVRRRKAKEGE